MSKRNFKKLYESIPYQVALRAMYEIFDGDEAEVVDSVVINGWVTSVNPATGHKRRVCMLSVQASREEIMGLNIVHVDPKACFGVLLDDNNRQPICPLHFNTSQKYLGVFDENKDQKRIPIDSLDEIYDHADKLRRVVAYYCVVAYYDA